MSTRKHGINVQYLYDNFTRCFLNRSSRRIDYKEGGQCLAFISDLAQAGIGHLLLVIKCTMYLTSYVLNCVHVL